MRHCMTIGQEESTFLSAEFVIYRIYFISTEDSCLNHIRIHLVSCSIYMIFSGFESYTFPPAGQFSWVLQTSMQDIQFGFGAGNVFHLWFFHLLCTRYACQFMLRWRRQYIHAITNYTCTFGSVAAHLGYFWANNLVFPKRHEQFQGLPTTNRSRSKFDDVPFPSFFLSYSLDAVYLIHHYFWSNRFS